MPGCLVDSSVWVAWYFPRHPHHEIVAAWLSERSSSSPALLCRATEQSVLRLITTATICRAYSSPPVTNTEAVAVLANWRSRPHIHNLEAEPEGTRDLWLKLAAIPSASPKTWMDSYLAAFATRAELSFVTLDADFRRFETSGLSLWLLPPL